MMRIFVTMPLAQRHVIVIVTLMVLSLLGLVSVQVYLLGLAMSQKDQSFRQNVFAALNAVSQRLETGEAATLALGTAVSSATGGQMKLFLSQNDINCAESLTIESVIVDHEEGSDLFDKPRPGSPFSVADGVLSYEVTSPQHVTIRAYDRLAGTDRVVVDTFRTPGRYEIDLTREDLDRGQFMWVFRSDSASQIFESGSGFSFRSLSPYVTASRKGDFVKRVVTNLMVTELEPIEARIDADKLDSLLDLSLRDVGIDLAHAFGIASGISDSLRVVRPAKFARALGTSEFRTRLFPHDLLAARSDLVVHFPDRNIYLWKQMATLLSLSVLFTLIVVAVFGYTIRVIVTQKRFAVRIVDFINNMTHEFKTPISTVALATEAMMRPEAAGDEDKIARYGRMIMHENHRMRTQVEKILQMAVLEEGDYDFKRVRVNLHALIEKAVETANLQVSSRDGSIEVDLQATNMCVDGDAVHLLNVINNLLDNANKYSPDTPRIRISTRNEGEAVCLRVSDAGMGISAHDQAHVFEKYYRVSTGNVHNVKGFGLGLSYVRLIVEAHGGSIALKSEIGRGTTVDVKLPVAGPGEESADET